MFLLSSKVTSLVEILSGRFSGTALAYFLIVCVHYQFALQEKIQAGKHEDTLHAHIRMLVVGPSKI